MDGPDDARRFAEYRGDDPVLRPRRIAVHDAADRCRGRADGPAYDLARAALSRAIEELCRRPREHLGRRHVGDPGG